jgi:xanthine dehydrogenase accessory factor
VTGVLEAAAALVAAERFGALATVVAGPDLGASALLDIDRGWEAGSLPVALADPVAADAVALVSRELSRTLSYDDYDVFIEAIAPRPHLVIFGAVHIGQELCAIGRRMGFHVTVADARPAFTTPERFPEADVLLIGWPDQVEVEFDRRTHVVVLSHDARFEDPLWPRVLDSPAAYVGAMGSRKTVARRRRKLEAAGFTEAAIDRIHGPIGLPIGAETPAEVAVAILAEITANRYRPDQPLELIGQDRPGALGGG